MRPRIGTDGGRNARLAMTHLFAISDLHLSHPRNREVLERIRPRPRDWLVLAGDLGEKLEHVALAFSRLRGRFRRLLWTPGNHELWTERSRGSRLAGPAKYAALLELAREHDVITPEDPYPRILLRGTVYDVVLMFLLYDYSFRPDHVSLEDAVDWAAEAGTTCPDEICIDPAPHPSIGAWCAERIGRTRKRLAELDPQVPKILVNHFPLRRDLVTLPQNPRYEIWCGTRTTETWHLQYRAAASVHGHLHLRGSTLRDGIPFTDVSLGYPEEWPRPDPEASFLHEVEPAVESADTGVRPARA